MPQGVTWGHPDIEAVFCPVPVKAGTYTYEGNTDCCVFAPGLGVSDGVAYPVNIDITLELQNRNTDVSALALQGQKCHQIIGDKIRAQAQATAIFTKIILSTTETSATTNAMNFALDSAERLLNQAGTQR